MDDPTDDLEWERRQRGGGGTGCSSSDRRAEGSGVEHVEEAVRGRPADRLVFIDDEPEVEDSK